jgi:hypothetical protein
MVIQELAIRTAPDLQWHITEDATEFKRHIPQPGHVVVLDRSGKHREDQISKERILSERAKAQIVYAR